MAMWIVVIVLVLLSAWLQWSRKGYKDNAERFHEGMNMALGEREAYQRDYYASQSECQRLTKQNAEMLKRHREECAEYESRMRANAEDAEQREKLAREERDAVIERASQYVEEAEAIRSRYTLSRQQNSSVVAMTIFDPQARRDVGLRMTQAMFVMARDAAKEVASKES